jgi:hypothetical protein
MGLTPRQPGRRVGCRTEGGGAMVTRLLHEMLLFYCMVAFVTGIVIAHATLLG